MLVNIDAGYVVLALLSHGCAFIRRRQLNDRSAVHVVQGSVYIIKVMVIITGNPLYV